MPWIKKEYDCGNCIIVQHYFCTRYGSKGNLTYQKTDEKGKTTEAQMRYSERRAMLKADVIVNSNFHKGDYYITFTFAKGKLPDSREKINRIWKTYSEKLRKVYRKRGVELKYYGTLQDEGCRPHFHFIFNNEFNIADFPEWKYGNPKIELLDGRVHHNIGSYFARGTTKEDKSGNKLYYRGRIYASRNLNRPKPKITRLKGSNWRDIPKNRKGYYVDTTTLENGYTENPFNKGVYRYQCYVLCKINSKERLNI